MKQKCKLETNLLMAVSFERDLYFVHRKWPPRLTSHFPEEPPPSWDQKYLFFCHILYFVKWIIPHLRPEASEIFSGLSEEVVVLYFEHMYSHLTVDVTLAWDSKASTSFSILPKHCCPSFRHFLLFSVKSIECTKRFTYLHISWNMYDENPVLRSTVTYDLNGNR